MNCAELRTLRVLHRSSFTRSLHLQEAPDGLSSGSFAPALGFSFLCSILWPLCWNIRCLNAERVAPPGESLERIKAQLKFGWRNELLRITSSTGGAGVSATSWVYLVDRFSETRQRNHRAAQRWVTHQWVTFFIHHHTVTWQLQLWPDRCMMRCI